jgi:histidyl-tRNA synthetase
MPKYQLPRGTRDVLPSDAHLWRHVVDVFQGLVEGYGYGEIRTPMFEDLDLFVRSSGETSDIVSKEMYNFKDKGDREISLKPEGTAPAMRAYIEHSLGQPGQVTRLWYFTPIFRYGRPQKGRYRQSHQVGMELIGSTSPRADAEVIEITMEFYRRLGLSGLKVVLNSIGRATTRQNYQAALLEFLGSWMAEQPTEEQDKVLKNPLRVLDTKDANLRLLLAEAPIITSFLEDESKTHFEAVQALLTEASVPYVLDPQVVRGLDYYTDIVFEVLSDDLGAQSSLCGGGRYDNLIGEMGGPPTASVGVAMGVERALLVMEALGKEPAAKKPDVFIISGANEASQGAALARRLRQEGLAALTDIDGRGFKQQFKQADRSGARFALILGEEELAGGFVTLKNLVDGTQVKVSEADAVAAIRAARPVC